MIKRQDEHDQRINRQNTPSPDQWKSFLMLKIKKFQKNKNLSFFSIAKYWFIAVENNPSITFDFVYSTPLISMLEFYLLHFREIQSIDDLANILQIVSILTSFNTPKTPFFSTQELFQVYNNLLLNENKIIVKFTLIILAQILFKQPELLPFYYSSNYLNLLLKFLVSDTDYISGISVFLLCEFAFFDLEKANTIFQTLFTFANSASIKAISTLFESLYFFAQNSPQYLSALIINNFCILCNEILKKISNDTINIANSIISILSLVITHKNGSESFSLSNIIATFSQFNYISPNVNQELLSLLVNLFTKLLLLSDPDINRQIIQNQIIEKFCICGTQSEFISRINAIRFILTILLSNNKEMLNIVVNNSGIQLILDNFENFDEEMALVAIKSLISFLSISPEFKNLILTYDIDKLTDIFEGYNSEAISDQECIFLSLIQ